MRLSAWRAAAKHRESVSNKVVAVLESVLGSLGAEPDPHVWISWGDDPDIRYMLFVPVAAGLVVAHVRVNVPQEGPRASAKLIRWSRLQPGDIAIESQARHRLMTFQLEQQVLKGVDDEAEAIARFALVLLAAIDGRPWPPFDAPTARRGTSRAASGSRSGRAATRAPTKASATKAAPGSGTAGQSRGASKRAAGAAAKPPAGTPRVASSKAGSTAARAPRRSAG